MKDNFGIEIHPGDSVIVLAWGDGARLVDCGITRPVLRFNRTRIVIQDADGWDRAIHPCVTGVVNRATGIGYEGNRTRTTN